MAEYVSVEEARRQGGLRLVVPNLPGPWAEAAKSIFHVKRLPFVRVLQRAGEANEDIVAWTGESNAPQVVWQDEPVRTGWVEILLLAERLATEPRLLPADAAERAELLGLAFLLCGEEGFGWQRRLMMFHQVLSLPTDVLPESNPVRGMIAGMGRRYGYSAEAAEAAPARAAGILGVFGARLEAQRERGSRYLLGDSLTALDLYSAVFAALVAPLPPEQCPMPEPMRRQYTCEDPRVREAAAPIWLEHRDFVYAEHLELPIDL